MGGGEALGDLQRVVQGLLLRDWAGVEPASEGLAFQKLHDGVGDPVVSPEVENRKDVGVGERRDRLRLALEPRQGIGIACDGLGQHLDRHLASEPWVPRAVDLTHPASSERAEDLVGTQVRAAREMPASVLR